MSASRDSATLLGSGMCAYLHSQFSKLGSAGEQLSCPNFVLSGRIAADLKACLSFRLCQIMLV